MTCLVPWGLASHSISYGFYEDTQTLDSHSLGHWNGVILLQVPGWPLFVGLLSRLQENGQAALKNGKAGAWAVVPYTLNPALGTQRQVALF